MLFHSTCASCTQPGPTLCRRCRFALISTPAVCPSAGIRAALPFDGMAKQLVVALKYRNRRGAAKVLAEQLVRRLRLGDGPRPDIVTWAPTSPRRAQQRGYDQAELLARAVARQLGVPCRRLLYREHGLGDGHQTGRSRAERLGGAAFRVRPAVRGRRVLVVDDVVTTGSTLGAAGRSLQRAGAEAMLVAVCAAGRERAGEPSGVVLSARRAA